MTIKITLLINHSEKQDGRTWTNMDRIHLAQDRDHLWAPVNIIIKLQAAEQFEKLLK
jgi:hypothetical protein